MEEEYVDYGFDGLRYTPSPLIPPICTCKCLRTSESSEHIEISGRKLQILTTVERTENYLRERRIPELIRFLLTKVLADLPEKPTVYLEKLMDECMLFRAGHGNPPVLYDVRHLEAVIKSFDPGNRGWITAGQVRRALVTLGFSSVEKLEDRIPTDDVLNLLCKIQEQDLYKLLSAGTVIEPDSGDDTAASSTDV